VTYEVNLKVKDWPTYTEIGQWLRAEHIQEVLDSHPEFIDAEIFDIHPQDGQGSIEMCVQYRLRSKKALDEYFRDSASKLRQAVPYTMPCDERDM